MNAKHVCSAKFAWFTVCFGVMMIQSRVEADDSFKKQAEAWREKHQTDYSAATGWLALTNLDWLSVGENRFGTDPSNKILLPAESVPAVAGSIHVTGDRVEIVVADDVKLSVNSELVKSANLQIDTATSDSNSRDEVLINDRLRFQLIRRAGKLGVRVRDSKSKGILEFKGMEWYEYSDSYRVLAKYQRYEPSKKLMIVNSRGDSVEADIPGYVEFMLKGTSFRLDAQRESKTELLIVFADLTNQSTTYPPGRFLNVLEPAGQQLTLDFNLAYNPPCAFSPFTLCPMPPKQNRLSVAIEAGEKRVPH